MDELTLQPKLKKMLRGGSKIAIKISHGDGDGDENGIVFSSKERSKYRELAELV